MRAKSAISVKRLDCRNDGIAASRVARATLGFTLIELLTAMVVLLMIVAMLATAFNAASTAWRGSERDIERFQNARATLDLIARDLTQAVVSPNVPFYANSNSLAFVATNNDDTNAVDMAEVVYRLNLDQTSTAPFKLTRRYTRSATNNTATAIVSPNPWWDFYTQPVVWPATASYTNIVCDNVVSFSVQCYDNAGNPTASYWNSTAAAPVWQETLPGPTTINLLGSAGTAPMIGLPPAFIDVHLGVIDNKTAALLTNLPPSSAAFANVLRQSRRDFNVYVKIPQR